MFIKDDWETNPPEDIESQVYLLDLYKADINKKGQRGSTLRYIFQECKKVYQDALSAVKRQEPAAFFKPSYEQALLLNSWVWGFNFPICFAANRIGKTMCFVFNAILWLFPNNPQWRAFKPYIDHLGRYVEVIPRPPLQNMIPIQKLYQEYPEFQGDPYLQPNEPKNQPLFNKIKSLAPHLFAEAWPLPPIQRGGQIWLGAPDNEFHKRIIMKRWRELLPPASILKDSESDRMFAITTQSNTNPKTTAHEIVCKSYESEDTKWSGDAVQGIVLTEGFTKDILDELKMRLVNEAFASWDYTPAEARNSGHKTALAYKVYKHEEELPLRSFVFIKFSVRQAPSHIIPEEKKNDLIRMLENKEEGKARLDGDFFTSSGLVLDKIDRDFHCLPWTLQELLQQVPNGRFYRGFDPGWDHPAACAWGYLSPNNVWFIYRFYSKRGTTISQRCKDIIELSNNQREKDSHTIKNQVMWREVHPHPHSEVFTLTATDYHVFKTDETTGNTFALNYNMNGLVITESTHMGPEARATTTNNMLDKQNHLHLAHPLRNTAPGSRIYFLTKEPGVAAALDQFDQIFWDRYKAGDNAGLPKDKVQLHGDDELDALSYLTAAGYVWTPYKPTPRLPKENKKQEVATLQQRLFPEPAFAGGFH